IEIETKSGKIFYNTVNLNKMQEAELNVFPNPFVNQVTVSLNAIIESNATLQLIDNNTKVLIQKQVTPDQLSSGYVISQLNDYKPGVYFVRVVANSVTKSFRIVKQ
ncbi:MAG: T9SS type A sorting domain-containing protein, partial [Bacteroidia bacterium]